MKAPNIFSTNTTRSTGFPVHLQKKLQYVRKNYNYRKLDIWWLGRRVTSYNFMHEDFSTEQKLPPYKEEREVKQMISSNLWLCKTKNPVSMIVNTVG